VKLKIGISPCPNDTFIFESLYQQSASEKGLAFDFVFADVEELNRMAAQGLLDIVKVSYANYFRLTKEYALLPAGGAMGKGVGPLLIGLPGFDETKISGSTIAIPGWHTTARFLLQYAYPEATQLKEYIFSEVEAAVLNQEVDAGVIIHENRFTYQQKGLICYKDLGTWWESQTQLPIPLGAIAIRRSISVSIQKEINDWIRSSIHNSKKQYPALSNFITSHATEMEEDVMRRHIELYVNQYSLDPGEEGRKAIQYMSHFFEPLENPTFYSDAF